jgi:hypothetical protein
MSFSYVKRATFLCPTMTTGGPEAIHQVAQLLNEQGLPSDIAYYGPGGDLRLDGGAVLVTPPAENPCLTAYAKYEPVVCRKFLLRRHHLVVLPEPLALEAPVFSRATVAVWWLSVDNTAVATDPRARHAFFGLRDVHHFTQSEYAADFLRRNGVAASHPLGDFIDPLFTATAPAGPNAAVGVAYNPAKGAELADAFFAAHPELRPVPLRGMTKDGVVAALRGTLTYVDFGHLPGKDRLPREAAASGAVVFVRRAGAGRFAEDFPIPEFFRFDDADVASGELARRIGAVQGDPERYWRQQEEFRAGIRGERAELAGQLLDIRGRSRAA